jgi:hypothetical protein
MLLDFQAARQHQRQQRAEREFERVHVELFLPF